MAFSKKKPSETEREARLIVRMSEHKVIAESRVALIKSLNPRDSLTLLEAFEKYQNARKKFNAFIETFSLYVVNKPNEMGDQVFKDLANETDKAARDFETYSGELIHSKFPKSKSTDASLGLFGPGPEPDWKSIGESIWKIVVDSRSATRKRKTEERERFAEGMKKQTLWSEWSKIEPAT